jgi:monooxygenase
MSKNCPEIGGEWVVVVSAVNFGTTTNMAPPASTSTPPPMAAADPSCAPAAFEHTDVVVVGAGISGIAAGHYLQEKCPNKKYLILEGRECLGGTWDLFRYPGIRSDSDMYTLGYSFKPWTDKKAIANADVILNYIRDVAKDEGISKHIRFNHFVKKANWSNATNLWTLEIEQRVPKSTETKTVYLTTQFVFMCSGYYDYNNGYSPEFPNKEDFRGTIVHPQHWPEDLDIKDKKIVVVGSGATAVTLIPQLAKKASHVTMLQRSPTYVVSRPSEDVVAKFFRRILPLGWAYFCTRWFHIVLGMYFFSRAKKYPERSRRFIINEVGKMIGKDQAEKHFSPKYMPWDQRLCLVPDNDMFLSIKEGKASVVTDTIDRFTPDGIKVSSGDEVKADIIVTATGLNIRLLGGMEVFVEGEKVDISQCWSYKHMMLTGIPNFSSCFGYPNAAWTLKAELNCEYFCRLVNHMDYYKFNKFLVNQNDPSVKSEPWLQLSSGYIQRAANVFPKRGSASPWRPQSNYISDMLYLRFGSVLDKSIKFSK